MRDWIKRWWHYWTCCAWTLHDFHMWGWSCQRCKTNYWNDGGVFPPSKPDPYLEKKSFEIGNIELPVAPKPTEFEIGLAMLSFFEKQRDWSYETFGPPSFKGPKGPLAHLKKEAEEAREEVDPEKRKVEIVDCLFLVFDAAHRSGMSYVDLIRGAFAKLEVNKKRTWPDWRGTNPDNPIEHVRDGENNERPTVS